MELKQLTDNWKCIGILVATAAALCGTAIAVDQRYAHAAMQKEMQQQIYTMQTQMNYNQFQMRLDSLQATCEKTTCTAETLRTIEWLKKQIKVLEKQMGLAE